MTTTILVIEDEIALLEEIVEILTFEGFEVHSAENGAVGVEIARQVHPDLIVSDIMMPVLDGYGVLMELQNDEHTRLIPFIFLTARGTSTDLRTGMNLGADDYITKPFHHEELLKSISTRLKKSEAVTQEMDLRDYKIDHLQQTILITLPHELRTPLSSIKGYSELLADDTNDLSSAQIQSMVTGIQRGATRLHRLIENYLLYSQLEIRKYNDQDVQNLIRFYRENPIFISERLEAIAIERADAYQRRDDLRLDLDHVAIPLPVEEMGKIMHELTDNAFKFSSPGTPVTATLSVDNHDVTITVADQGRGMTPEQLQRIDAYMQFNRRMYEQQGIGLGLTIARKMTVLFNGEFTIDSEENVGTQVSAHFQI